MKRVVGVVIGSVLLAACGGEAEPAQSESAVTKGEWACGATAVPYDLPNDCWMQRTALDGVCTRELDVEQPSTAQVETCVLDADGRLYVVSFGDRAELRAPEGWAVLDRESGAIATPSGFPVHELAHCADYLGSGTFIAVCSDG